MSDMHRRDELEPGLAQALGALRDEEPVAPLRRELVWSGVERAHRSAPRVATASARWTAVAAVTLLIAGALLVSRPWADQGQRSVRSPGPQRDALLADAALVLRALPGVRLGTAAADSLHGRSARLLAATRVIVDRAPAASTRTALLHDMEYLLAQVVEGGLDDEVEHELALETIRSRRLLDRVEQEGAE